VMDPCIPRWWQEYDITYRFGRTIYKIKVENPLGLNRGVAVIEKDGVEQGVEAIALLDDGKTHSIRVVLGEAPATSDKSDSQAEPREEQASRRQ
jgi:cyclic beta-1,2-glucan glucanotransferase